MTKNSNSQPRVARKDKDTHADIATVGVRGSEKCLLSEFDRPGFRWIYNLKRPGLVMGLICFFWAVLTVIVGDKAKANGIALTVTATVTSIPGLAGKWRQTFGYLAEPNFGFYFLFVAPFLTWLAFYFSLCAGRALSELKVKGVFCGGTDSSVSQSPLDYVSKRNHQLVPLLFIPIISIPFCIWCQFSSMTAVSKGYSLTNGNVWNLGHVQSPFLLNWLEFFNKSSSNELARLAVLEKGNHTDDAANSVLAELISSASSTNSVITRFLAFKNIKDPPTAFKLADAVTNGVIKLSADARFAGGTGANNTSAARMRWFRIFVVMSQIQVGMLFALEFWVLGKIIFWLGLLYTLLPRANKTQSYKFKPLLTDPTKRFGLGGLFRPYNLIVLIVAMGSLYFALQLTEEEGVRAITTDPSSGSLLTRIMNLVVILTVICSVVVGPIFGFKLIMTDWTNIRVARLNEEFARATTERQEEIESELEKLAAQKTWPKGDFWFQVISVIAIAMLVAPFGSELPGLSPRFKQCMNIPAIIKKQTHVAVRNYYKLNN